MANEFDVSFDNDISEKIIELVDVYWNNKSEKEKIYDADIFKVIEALEQVDDEVTSRKIWVLLDNMLFVYYREDSVVCYEKRMEGVVPIFKNEFEHDLFGPWKEDLSKVLRNVKRNNTKGMRTIYPEVLNVCRKMIGDSPTLVYNDDIINVFYDQSSGEILIKLPGDVVLFHYTYENRKDVIHTFHKGEWLDYMKSLIEKNDGKEHILNYYKK